jgi:hypothetical protein
MPYLWSIFNTGVKAQYTSGKFSFMAGVTNPTDLRQHLKQVPPKKRLLVS